MDFIKWLQGRLVLHGHAIAADGVVGPATRNALLEFQRRKKIKQTGIADDRTVKLLRAPPSSDASAQRSTPPLEAMPPWMAEMYRRKGLHEARDNRSLSEWLRIGKFLGNPAKLPWCGDAVETCIVKTLPSEPVPNNPFWAQSWAKFGIGVDGPRVGAIGVIRWSAKAGHVGIVASAAGGRVTLLGGNQSDAITLSSFPLSKFIAFRWPKTYPLRIYPPLGGNGDIAGFSSTR